MKFPKLITRRRLKWTGLAATLLLAVSMVGSIWYQPSVSWTSALSPSKWRARILPGGIDVVRAGDGQTWGVHVFIEEFEKVLEIQPSGFAASPDPFTWLPAYESDNSMLAGMRFVTIPLWIPLSLIALSTMTLCYRDRKPKPGCCAKCRYDLTGLRGDRCPECGTKTVTAL